MPTRSKLPAYRRHKPTGQAVVTLSGIDFYLGRHGAKLSRDAYDRVVGEWLAAGRSIPSIHSPGARLLVELIHAFHKANVIPPSHANEFKSVMKIMVRLYGRSPTADFGPLALKVVREQMIAAGLRRKTINQRVHAVRRIFRWDVEHQMVEPAQFAALKALEPLTAGKTTAPESHPVRPVSIDHVEACLPFMTPTVAAMVRQQMLTGMRAGEVCQMRTGDIHTSGPVWVYRLGSHKTARLRKIREIPLASRPIDILRPLLLADLLAPIFSPARADAERRAALTATRKTPIGQGNSPGSKLKPNPKKAPGSQYDIPAYRQAIEYATARAFRPPIALARARGETTTTWRARLGSKWADLVAFRRSVHWHPHQLRHTSATLVRKQFGLDHAQKALGHSHAAVTERYAAISLEKAVEVAQAIG